jgi:glycosyltransferase involved in cell wall biosynthesis
MRILQVVPRYAPAWAFGGGVRITFELARQWVQHGHEVTVYTSDQESDCQRFEALKTSLAGINIQRFRNPINLLAARYGFLFYYPLGLAQALRAVREQFDLVYVAESRGPYNRWVARYVPIQGIPFVWSAYGGLAEGQGLRRVYRTVYDRIFGTRDMVQKADGLIAQTTHERNIYFHFGADANRVHVIPLAVNMRDFKILPPRGKFRQALGIGEEEKVILFLGRIHWTKGLQVLIPAFADLVRSMPNSRLVIVGWDNGFLRRAKQLVHRLKIDGKVLFPGSLYGIERFRAYADADVFALTPGVYEETSLAALEACACGIPCVITQQCEIPGLDEAKAGITVEYSREKVARALTEILNENVTEHWGVRARCLVQDRFAIEVVSAEHERLFEQICSKRFLPPR